MSCFQLLGQQSLVNGRVSNTEQQPLEGVQVVLSSTSSNKEYILFTNQNGMFVLEQETGELPRDLFPINIRLSSLGYVSIDTTFEKRVTNPIELVIEPMYFNLPKAEIQTQNEGDLVWMNSIHEGSIYRGIKSSQIILEKEIVVPGEVQARAVFSKIPGVNIWESDAAGLQIGIGVRGLDPNRTSHLSVRQNGSPIAADPLGYPESYYTPPLESVNTIEYVSGAGALQYGSQLGGMLNFDIKKGDYQTPGKVRMILSGSAYEPHDESTHTNANVFLDHASGAKNTSHYLCLDLKDGIGWRNNTEFKSSTALGSFSQRIQTSQGELELNEDLTIMKRTEHQPGGLTDAQFNSNPRNTNRNRNWFEVDWNVGRLGLKWRPNDNLWRYNASVYVLSAKRKALGFLGTPNRIDFLDNRDMISASFSSLGVDLKASRVWDYNDKINALAIGFQGYSGNTIMKQGHADATDLPNFEYLNPNDLEGSNFILPNNQLSAFTQGIVSLSKNLSITPGLRWEFIDTRASGWYREYIIDGAGNILEDSIFTSNKDFQRHVVLPGIGFSYNTKNNKEVYGNAVANFRAINFSDIQIRNLGVVVDPNINDEKGSNVDLGARSNSGILNWDFSIFMLNYKDKIGLYPTTIPDPIIIEKPVLLRTNIANARTFGLEGLIQATLIERENYRMGLLVSASLMKGYYISGDSEIFIGNQVENIPSGTFRTVVSYISNMTHSSIQWNWVGEQYTDATNAERTANALYGIIPSYNVLDFSISHSISDKIKVGFKLNNILNSMYFTRRATGYPGPGIMPSDGRNIRVSLLLNN
tara:strand:- start:593 stop:3028 length:2436 start_codon:yes stop_codon:yes gene_type:complete